jgi:hypothetical protein
MMPALGRKGVKHEQIDGSAPDNKERRRPTSNLPLLAMHAPILDRWLVIIGSALFAISGAGAVYPQIFVQ